MRDLGDLAGLWLLLRRWNHSTETSFISAGLSAACRVLHRPWRHPTSGTTAQLFAADVGPPKVTQPGLTAILRKVFAR